MAKIMDCVYFFRSMFLTSVAYDGYNKMRVCFSYLAHVWWVLLGQAIACCVVEQTTLFWHYSHFFALGCDSPFLFKFGAEMAASDAAAAEPGTSIIYIFFNLHFSAICCVAFQFQTTTNIVILQGMKHVVYA